MIELKEGLQYLQRNGTRTASLVNTGNHAYPFEDLISKECWQSDGRYFSPDICSTDHEMDLVQCAN